MKHISRALALYCLLTTLLFVLILFLPVNSISLDRFHISAADYRFLLFLVELPLILIWLAAFYGYAKLEQYAHTIKHTPEAPGFCTLSRGYRWLAWGLPAQALPYLLLTTLDTSHRDLQGAAVVITNYISVVFTVVGLTYIHQASVQLLNRLQQKPPAMIHLRPVTLLFGVLAALYCGVVLSHISGQQNAYYLPGWLLVVTLVLPYLYAWFRGLQAVYNIVALAKGSQGYIYRRALGRIALGVVVVIISLIAAQVLRSAIPRAGSISLSATLLAIYAVYLFMMAGYSLLAYGSQRLRRIEEV